MKSIGIFGDSFTGNCGSIDYPGYEHHWTKLLARHYNCELNNYGLSGSSIYFSYKKFLEHYDKNDFNIFIVTEPTRYPIAIQNLSGMELHIGSLSYLESFTDNEIDKNIKNNLTGWFLSSNDQYHQDVAELMLDKIKNLDPKVLLVPSFPAPLRYSASLFDIQLVQLSQFSTPVWDIFGKYDENYEIMSGHFLPEFNKIVLDIIIKRIESGSWDWTLPENINLIHTFDDGWKKRKD